MLVYTVWHAEYWRQCRVGLSDYYYSPLTCMNQNYLAVTAGRMDDSALDVRLSVRRQIFSEKELLTSQTTSFGLIK